jgi:MoaA/NifB/PqqE/SkfB family radical SAM enzyme
MLNWIKRQVDKLYSPTLDWVQVEVTTYCNASCIYCPHTLMTSSWTERHLPIALFNALVPFLKHTDLVYLQGWGEPLLHPHFLEMVRICKDQGNRVGFTTNGMFLTENMIRRLVDLPVDIVAVSLAGTTPATHNRIRKGTDLDQILSHLERLGTIKAGQGSQAPAVHLAYLMLRSNFHELKEILPLARRVEAKQVVASNLTLIADQSLADEALFSDTERMDDYRNALDEIRENASREDIIFDYHGPSLDDDSLRCRENVHRACVINVEGEVVPCVFTNPVLSSHYIFQGESLPLESLSFGNIRNESLTRIWNNKKYVAFRNLFSPDVTKTPAEVRLNMPGCCVRCYKRLGTQGPHHGTPSGGGFVSDMFKPFGWKSGQA